MNWLGLQNKTCIVTGAAGGLGSRIAQDLAQAGASLVLLDLPGQCDSLALEVKRLGAKCISLSADISDANEVARVANESLQAVGPCHVLINTPAISGRPDPIMDVTPEKWARQLSVNINGYMFCAQQFGKQMAESGGSMVHIGSLSGRYPQAHSGAYSVTKAGIAMLSRVLALELAHQRIRSNVVSPAMVRTPLSEKFYGDPDLLRRREAFIPIGQVGTPQHISDAVLFLASERSAYVTGQDLLVDGGVEQVLMRMFPLPAPRH